MSFNWDGIMELFSGRYRPSWESVCGGSDVKGIMELADVSTYKPTPEAHGICTDEDIAALSRMMVKRDDSSLYFPRVILNDEEMCCAGVNCGFCDDDLWDTGKTPKKIQLVVSGVDWETSGCGEQDPNGAYILDQLPTLPCVWMGVSGVLLFFYQAYSDVPLGSWKESSCVIVHSSTLYGANMDRWYFLGGHDACGGDEGETYTNLITDTSPLCSFCLVGGCAFINYCLPAAAFDGQAVVSWPI